jgi:N-acetyllactosaminide beta-1,3-N-acetylglucosaminyltransferase
VVVVVAAVRDADGFNRISQVCHARMSGYRFFVLRHAFAVHHGFKLAESFHPGKQAELDRNRDLFRQFKRELRAAMPHAPHC